MEEYNPPSTSELPIKEKLAQRIWDIVRGVVFTLSPFFARRWRRLWIALFARLIGEGDISKTASFSKKSVVDFPWRLTVGDRVTIDDGVWLYALDRISIGKLAIIGRDVKLITGSHDVSSPNFKLVTKPISVGEGAWIATGAIVLPGVSIGEGAVIGAGAVVSKDVPAWTIVAGNPAKVIGHRVLS